MRDLFGGENYRGGGCQCASCRETNRHIDSGFGQWPRGNPAGRKSNAEYSSHCTYALSGEIKGMKVGPDGAGFYGTPAGMTRAQVDAILRATYAEESPC